MAEFKDRLEEALILRNMKPADLAKATGIGEGAISQYRKGAYIATQRNLEKIAKALNVPIPWLMGAVDAVEIDPAFAKILASPSKRELMNLIADQDDDTAAMLLQLLKHFEASKEQESP